VRASPETTNMRHTNTTRHPSPCQALGGMGGRGLSSSTPTAVLQKDTFEIEAPSTFSAAVADSPASVPSAPETHYTHNVMHKAREWNERKPFSDIRRPVLWREPAREPILRTRVQGLPCGSFIDSGRSLQPAQLRARGACQDSGD